MHYYTRCENSGTLQNTIVGTISIAQVRQIRAAMQHTF